MLLLPCINEIHVGLIIKSQLAQVGSHPEGAGHRRELHVAQARVLPPPAATDHHICSGGDELSQCGASSLSRATRATGSRRSFAWRPCKTRAPRPTWWPTPLVISSRESSTGWSCRSWCRQTPSTRRPSWTLGGTSTNGNTWSSGYLASFNSWENYMVLVGGDVIITHKRPRQAQGCLSGRLFFGHHPLSICFYWSDSTIQDDRRRDFVKVVEITVNFPNHPCLDTLLNTCYIITLSIHYWSLYGLHLLMSNTYHELLKSLQSFIMDLFSTK